MKMSSALAYRSSVIKGQRGVTTLAITLLLLVIITLVVMFSTNVAFFEQRTSNNENRARLSEQAAEYALNLSGEFLKANVANIVTAGSGWLGAGGTRRWTLCSTATMTPSHPCMAERDATRRSQLYYYNFSGSAALPYNTTSMGAGVLSLIGESGVTGDGTGFTPTTVVEALLCRLDTTLTEPQCRAIPDATSANRIAVVLIATTTMADESSKSVVKETWASISQSIGGSPVPLVASGTVKGLGTATIVAGPNGGGTGVPVSIWSPCPVSIGTTEAGITADKFTSGCDAPGGGVGSVQTCELDDYLGNTPLAQLQTNPGCAASNTCRCDLEVISAGGSTKIERHDVLDRDGCVGQDDAQGLARIPDIQFFPTSRLANIDGNCDGDFSDTGVVDPITGIAVDRVNVVLDKNTDPLDDSMFEWIFGQDVVPENTSTVPSNCGSGTENCARVALRNMGAIEVEHCDQVPTGVGGSIYYVWGSCTGGNKFGNAALGTPTSPIIVVVNGDAGEVVFSDVLHGIMFIRSNNDSADFKSTGGKFFGSIVVEGEVTMSGNPHIVYVNTNTETPGKPLPAGTKFAKVTGSWLDNNTGF